MMHKVVGFFMSCITFSLVAQAESDKYSTPYKDTILCFYDGEKTIVMSKVPRPSVLYEGAFDTILLVETEFELKHWKLEAPIIDTLFDPDNQSLVLATDTLEYLQFHYAKRKPLSHKAIKQTVADLCRRAESQALTVSAIRYLVHVKKGRALVRNVIPSTKDLKDSLYVTGELYLSNGKFELRYPVLFE